MKTIFNAFICLVILAACSSCIVNESDNSEPALEILRYDFVLPLTNEYYTQPETVFISDNGEVEFNIFVHVYNETPLKSATLEIVYEGDYSTLIYDTEIFDPPLGALSDRETESWTLGWKYFLLQGEIEEGIYLVSIWVTDVNGKESFIETFDLIVGGDLKAI